jgi:hypothetical protein
MLGTFFPSKLFVGGGEKRRVVRAEDQYENGHIRDREEDKIAEADEEEDRGGEEGQGEDTEGEEGEEGEEEEDDEGEKVTE